MNTESNSDPNTTFNEDEPDLADSNRNLLDRTSPRIQNEIGWSSRFLENRRKLNFPGRRKKIQIPYKQRLFNFLIEQEVKEEMRRKKRDSDTNQQDLIQYDVIGVEARMKNRPEQTNIPLESFRVLLDEMYVKNLDTINLAAKRLKNNGYHLGRLIDIGRTSYVYELFGKNSHFNDKLFAVKIIDFQLMPTDLMEQILENEFNILANFKHPNIVQLHSYFFKQNLYLSLVMEYAPTNLLLWCSTSQDPDDLNRSRYWSYGLNKALVFLHSLGFAHRDLRASDVLLWPDGQIKISDFTHAKYCINPQTNQPIMMERTTDDLQYTAPELFYTRTLNNMDGMDPFKGDCFAFGVLLYMICFRKYPFGRFNKIYSMDEKQAFLRRIRRNRWRFELDQNEHRSLYELLKGLLTPHSTQRISMLQALASPWYRENADPRLREDIAFNFQYYFNGGKGMPNRIFPMNIHPRRVRQNLSQFNEPKFQPPNELLEENLEQFQKQYRRKIRSKEMDEKDEDYDRYVQRNQNLIDFETFKQQYRIQTNFPAGVSPPRPRYRSLPQEQSPQRRHNLLDEEEEEEEEIFSD